MGERLRVGIIGIGFWAYVGHVPALRQTGRAEVVAVSRRDPEALRVAGEALGGVAAYADWRDLLARAPLDAVVVSTAHHAHAEPAIAALDRGLHVLVDKPMALTARDAWAMVGAAERAGRVLMTGYGPRFQGRWRTAAAALREGAIGRVRQVAVAVCYDYRWQWAGAPLPPGFVAFGRQAGIPEELLARRQPVAGSWRRDPARMGGGALADNGAHLVDLALWLAGAPPVEVVALAERAGAPVELHLGLQARLADGGLLAIASSDGVPVAGGRQQARLTVFGDGGLLAADETEVWLQHGDDRQPLEPALPDTTADAAFVATILDGAPNLAPGAASAPTVALTEAAYRSAAGGGIVRVAPPGPGSAGAPA